MYVAGPTTVRRHPHAIVITIAALAIACGSCRPSVPPARETTAAEAVDIPALCVRIDRALAHARDGRRLDARVHGAWQVVHGILAFGRDFQIVHDGDASGAVDYLLSGGRLAGWSLRPGSVGIAAPVEPGSTTAQGHPDQWLGYLAQCGLEGLPTDTALRVGDSDHTVADLLEQAKADIRPGQEATWTLMALAAYLPPDAAWTAGDGSAWTTERVVAMEAEADLFGAACGGAHRAYGLAAALRACRTHGGGDVPAREPPLTGGWAKAAERLEDAIDRARRFQQSDGSFSIHSFDRPGTSSDVFAKLSATGHVFEVLAVALDDARLAEPWVARAAERLVTMLENTADVDVECGALYHAAHGLLLYRSRVCGDGAAIACASPGPVSVGCRSPRPRVAGR
ncbi:MAG: ADP-ribosylation factor-directed GTPase activating protein isoform b [Planctomycetia bacterium]|nr:ADP-ribosylation factor-directed GTPase activating protein isoform b [Planctomycetia bacterium]